MRFKVGKAPIAAQSGCKLTNERAANVEILKAEIHTRKKQKEGFFKDKIRQQKEIF